jgi:multidrug efflux system membrane fusion protein
MEPTTHSKAQILIGRVASALIIIGAIGSGLAVLSHSNRYPQTDDSEIFANFIGIAPQVEGPLIHLNVRDNEFVKKGDLLFEIDDRPYRYALEKANSEQATLEGQISDERRIIAAKVSAVSVSEANIHSTEADVIRWGAAVEQARADVAAAEQAVARAKAEWTYASNNLHRVEPLLVKQFVTVDQVDRARTSEAAQADALKQAESQLRQAQAALQATFDNCRVYAPFDARVTNLTISEGAYAHVGEQMFTLIDARTWWAVANFREGQLQHIEPGMRADVYVMSKPTQRFSGVVDSIGFGVTPDADLVGRFTQGLPDVQRTLNWVHLASRYPVRVRVENPPAELFRLSESAVVVIRGR